jgi:hypothetical protein
LSISSTNNNRRRARIGHGANIDPGFLAIADCLSAGFANLPSVVDRDGVGFSIPSCRSARNNNAATFSRFLVSSFAQKK